jgi:hypothetical protein
VANLTRRDGVESSPCARIPIRTRIVEFPLREANEALAALRAGTISGAAVLTNPAHEPMSKGSLARTPPAARPLRAAPEFELQTQFRRALPPAMALRARIAFTSGGCAMHSRAISKRH